MSAKRLGLLRRLATWLIRGPEAAFVLSDLEDTAERELARGISRWRVRWRYFINVLGSAYTVWRPRRFLPRLGVSSLDVKLGLRMLLKNSGLTFVAVFALAIGIPVGMVPAHFSAAIEAPLPFPEADRIQALRNFNVATSNDESPSAYDYARWRDGLTTFEDIAVVRGVTFNVGTEDGRGLPVAAAAVTASTFDVLRVRPALGRVLQSMDEADGAPAVVLIGHDLWKSRFASDPEIVGRTVRVGDTPHTVVGVMPEGFLFPARQKLWLPLRVDSQVDDHEAEQRLMVFGRLLENTTPAEAQIQLAAIGRRMSDEDPDTHAWLRPEVVPFPVAYFSLPAGGMRAVPGYYLVQTLTLLLLVVACANVSMLVLARTASRASELAVRTALGASRMRVVAQLFTEALVFAVLAAGVGLVLADLVSHNFDWMEQALPFWVDLGVTVRTAFWALSLAVVSAGVVSIIPALKVTGVSIQRTMQQSTARRSGVRFGGVSTALIIADVTLAVVAVGVALGLWNGLKSGVDGTSLQTDQYLSAQLGVPRVGTAAGSPFDSTMFDVRVSTTQRELVRRLSAEPGVRAVAFGNAMPGMDHRSRRIEIEGEARSGETENPRVIYARVGVDFFAAFEHQILAGRGFALSDLDSGRTSIVVNTTFVDQVLKGRNPIGRRIRYKVYDGAEPGPWYEIVGVVGPLGMNEAVPSLDAGFYHPVAFGEINPVRLAIQVGGDPSAFTPRLRELAGEVDPTAIISEPTSLDEVFSFNVFTIAWIEIGAFVIFGILVGLSVSGIYALMSFTIAQRTKELGIRAALGAQRNRIMLLIGKRAFAQLAVGVLLGAPIAGRLLYELRGVGHESLGSPVLVAMLVGVTVMILIATLACTVPTLRALRILPTEALRA